MNPFGFYNPTRILFGENRVAGIDEQIPGDARVMVLYGGESARR